jgi:ArsR family transcriptional regulator
MIRTKYNIESLERIAYILKTVAHPLRLGIVQLLDKNKELSVNEICESLDSEQSLTSHHLANMKLKGILECNQKGRQRYYRLKEKAVTQIMHCLEDCGCNM